MLLLLMWLMLRIAINALRLYRLLLLHVWLLLRGRLTHSGCTRSTSVRGGSIRSILLLLIL